MYALLIFFHIIFASVWAGGHLVLCTTVLPKALSKKDCNLILNFESNYEKIGIPSLIGQIITGTLLFFMRADYQFSMLFDWNNFLGRHFILKFITLAITLLLAVHARFKIIPALQSSTLTLLAIHIILVTLLSVFFILIGLSLRLNLFY
jgi:putative copper export protein